MTSGRDAHVEALLAVDVVGRRRGRVEVAVARRHQVVGAKQARERAVHHGRRHDPVDLVGQLAPQLDARLAAVVEGSALELLAERLADLPRFDEVRQHEQPLLRPLAQLRFAQQPRRRRRRLLLVGLLRDRRRGRQLRHARRHPPPPRRRRRRRAATERRAKRPGAGAFAFSRRVRRREQRANRVRRRRGSSADDAVGVAAGVHAGERGGRARAPRRQPSVRGDRRDALLSRRHDGSFHLVPELLKPQPLYARQPPPRKPRKELEALAAEEKARLELR